MVRKKKQKWEEPRWIKSIKKGSHGSKVQHNGIQQRYWTLISDYVRIHDFYAYHGACVSCGRTLDDWSDGHAGHYKAYAACNAFAKFNTMNIALQCPGCNQRDDGPVGKGFGDEMIRRHGEDFFKNFLVVNDTERGNKMEPWEVEKRMKAILIKMGDLKEQPDYYHRALGHINKEESID